MVCINTFNIFIFFKRIRLTKDFKNSENKHYEVMGEQYMKYNIEIKRENCIACGSCYSINPTHFEPDGQGKSTVIGGETDDSTSVGEFNDEGIESARDAEDSCPVSIITVTEL